MKKYTSIFIIILITGLFANAQSNSTKKADKLFSKLEFVDAAKEYEKLISKGEKNAYVYAQGPLPRFFIVVMIINCYILTIG